MMETYNVLIPQVVFDMEDNIISESEYEWLKRRYLRLIKREQDKNKKQQYYQKYGK